MAFPHIRHSLPRPALQRLQTLLSGHLLSLRFYQRRRILEGASRHRPRRCIEWSCEDVLRTSILWRGMPARHTDFRRQHREPHSLIPAVRLPRWRVCVLRVERVAVCHR